jgi:hypothetical protein
MSARRHPGLGFGAPLLLVALGVPVSASAQSQPVTPSGDDAPAGLAVGQFAGSAGIDYSYFLPSSGNDGQQIHVEGDGVVQVAGNLGIQGGVSYSSVATGGPRLNNWNISGGLDFHVPGLGPTELTLAPIVGYQQTHQGGFESKTIDYGAATRLRLLPSGVVLFAKAGGFSTTNDFCSGSSCSSSDSNGFFTGGGVTFYPDENFSITPSIDYTHFDPFGGSEEFDYSLKGVHKLGPVDIVLEYDHSDFAPGNFHVNTVSVGISIPLGYHAGAPLKIADDTQPLHAEFSPLYFRF